MCCCFGQQQGQKAKTGGLINVRQVARKMWTRQRSLSLRNRQLQMSNEQCFIMEKFYDASIKIMVSIL